MVTPQRYSMSHDSLTFPEYIGPLQSAAIDQCIYGFEVSRMLLASVLAIRRNIVAHNCIRCAMSSTSLRDSHNASKLQCENMIQLRLLQQLGCFSPNLFSSMSGMRNWHMAYFGNCAHYYTLIYAYANEGRQGCQ